MSASREKQNRQAKAGQTNPKTAREAQQRQEAKRSNLLYGLIAVAVVVAVIASVVWRSDLIPKMTTAATIDGEKYSVGEVSYYYQSAYRNFLDQYGYFASYLGLNTGASLKNQTISASTASMLGLDIPTDTAAEGTEDAAADSSTGMTWHEYFLNQALENMAVIQGGLKAADAEGFQNPASVQVQLQDNLDQLKTMASSSGLSVGQYLKSNFGSGVTEAVYREQMERVLRFGAYSDAFENGLTYTGSELEEAYAANPNAYDHVSYEIVSISGAAESTTDAEGNEVEPTEEESAAALKAAQDAAQAILDGYRDGGNLEDLAEENGGTYNNNESGSYTEGNATSEWLFDSARKAGDSTLLEDMSIEYVVVFHERFRDEYATVDVRHILVPLGTATLSSEDAGYDEEQAQLKADAHAKAEELLAQWQSGEATEDSFAALAMAESSDGSKYDGGLYTEVYQGQMVAEFNDWCFDSARQVGDTAVVDTQYGAHVMYFSGWDMDRWQSQVADTLRQEAYSEWEDGLQESVALQRNESGLERIG